MTSISPRSSTVFGSINVALRRDACSDQQPAPLDFASYTGAKPVIQFKNDHESMLNINVGLTERYNIPLSQPNTITKSFAFTKQAIENASTSSEKLQLASGTIHKIIHTLTPKLTPSTEPIVDFIERYLAYCIGTPHEVPWIRAAYKPSQDSITIDAPCSGPGFFNVNPPHKPSSPIGPKSPNANNITQFQRVNSRLLTHA